jgi:hypothetical protein
LLLLLLLLLGPLNLGPFWLLLWLAVLVVDGGKGRRTGTGVVGVGGLFCDDLIFTRFIGKIENLILLTFPAERKKKKTKLNYFIMRLTS